MPDPADLPKGHIVLQEPIERSAFDIVSNGPEHVAYLRAFDESGKLVWFYGPLRHPSVRMVAAVMLDCADQLEIADRIDTAARHGLN